MKEQTAAKNRDIVWISFDLGVQGDYEGLYRWFDAHDAEEGGDNVACLRHYEYDGDLSESLRKDLKRSVNIDKRTRVYVIRKESGKPKGKFIFGSRRRPPWTGYAPEQGEEEDYGA